MRSAVLSLLAFLDVRFGRIRRSGNVPSFRAPASPRERRAGFYLAVSSRIARRLSSNFRCPATVLYWRISRRSIARAPGRVLRPARGSPTGSYLQRAGRHLCSAPALGEVAVCLLAQSRVRRIGRCRSRRLFVSVASVSPWFRAARPGDGALRPGCTAAAERPVAWWRMVSSSLPPPCQTDQVPVAHAARSPAASGR